MEEVERLEKCHKEEIQDYGCELKLISVDFAAKANT